MVSVEEYLTTSYEIDCDFVDDHIERRRVGEREHSAIVSEVAGYVGDLARVLNLRAWISVRVRTGERRYRVPDICVTRGRGLIPHIITEPPLIVVEVLATRDRPVPVARRLRDFAAMSVEHIWIVDPFERSAMIFENDALRLQDDGILTAPEIPITINLAERFAAIDE